MECKAGSRLSTVVYNLCVCVYVCVCVCVCNTSKKTFPTGKELLPFYLPFLGERALAL